MFASNKQSEPVPYFILPILRIYKRFFIFILFLTEVLSFEQPLRTSFNLFNDFHICHFTLDSDITLFPYFTLKIEIELIKYASYTPLRSIIVATSCWFFNIFFHKLNLYVSLHQITDAAYLPGFYVH